MSSDMTKLFLVFNIVSLDRAGERQPSKRNRYRQTQQSDKGFLTSQTTQEDVEQMISKVEKPSGCISPKYFVVNIEE